MEALPVARPAVNPLRKPNQSHRSVEGLLRSGAFPGAVPAWRV